MAVNNISVGKDYSIVFYDPNTGNTVAFDDLQNFKITAQYHNVDSKPYNGPPRRGYVPDGYGITFNMMRTNPLLENYQLAANQRFEDGVHDKAGYLNEVVNNPDGTVSRYQYTGFVFRLNEVGDVSREKGIAMTGEAFASSKKALA